MLEDTSENEIRVGDFFDTVDREYLRATESHSIELNSSSELLPNITVPPVLETSNGSGTGRLASLPITSTPIHPSAEADLFVLSGLSDSESESERTPDRYGQPLLERLRNRPRRIIYTDSDSSSNIPLSNKPWKDREIKCSKYIDDLSLIHI